MPSAIHITLLLASVWACAAQSSTAQSNSTSQSVTGRGSESQKTWLVPKTYSLIQLLRFRMTGPEVISRRVETEVAFRTAIEQTLEKLGPGTFRFDNYTTHPSTSPGFEAYTSIDYDIRSYFDGNFTDIEPIQPTPDQYWSDHRSFEGLVFSLTGGPGKGVVFQIPNMWLKNTPVAAQRRIDDIITLNNTDRLISTTLNRIELTGTGLVPFAADKQSAFIQAVWNALGATTSLYSVNVSDWTETAAASSSGNRKLLQAAAKDRVSVDVWTQNTAPDYTPNGFWRTVLGGPALDTAFPNMNVTGRFFNATMFMTSFNDTVVGILHDPILAGDPASNVTGLSTAASLAAEPSPSASTTVDSSSGSGDDGLSGGAIAGIVIGAVIATALLAALAAVAILARSRRAARRADAEGVSTARAVAKESLDSFSGSSSENVLKTGAGGMTPETLTPSAKAGGASWASASTLWPSDGNSHTASSQEAELLAGGGRAPQIDINDVEICVDASGRRVVLGGGAFGTVYLGRHKLREVAVKVLPIESGLSAAVKREVELAERVSRDANVVQFYGSALAPDGSEALLLMELAEGGDLRAALDGPKGQQYLWQQKGAAIAADIARGLSYIHSTGVVHRDLKSSNVLLTAEGVAKVADIGAAALMNAEYVTTHFGTLAWAAPELLMADTHTQLSTKVDSYSLGVVMWELVTGKTPVRGDMRQVRVPEECPAAVAALISECMSESPDKRPAASTVGDRLRSLA